MGLDGGETSALITGVNGAVPFDLIRNPKNTQNMGNLLPTTKIVHDFRQNHLEIWIVPPS